MSKSLNELSEDRSETSEQPSRREELVASPAKAATHPNFLAAYTISRFNQTLGNLPVVDIVNILGKQIGRVKNGDLGRMEETLANQAIVLDTLFNSLAVKALQAPGMDMQAMVLKLALQSQRQCCLTVEALSAIKKPPAVTVVRQTNIGQAVQVNNGATDEIPQTNLENELLESKHGERLDRGAQIAPITVN
jgi:hypothetical protein